MRTRGITLDTPPMEETCCKNLYWNLRWRKYQKKMYIAQRSDSGRQQSLPIAKQEWAEESLVGRNSVPLFSSEKIFPGTVNNVEISKSLNWKPKVYKNGWTISTATDFATMLYQACSFKLPGQEVVGVGIKRNVPVKEFKILFPVPSTSIYWTALWKRNAFTWKYKKSAHQCFLKRLWREF